MEKKCHFCCCCFRGHPVLLVPGATLDAEDAGMNKMGSPCVGGAYKLLGEGDVEPVAPCEGNQGL